MTHERLFFTEKYPDAQIVASQKAFDYIERARNTTDEKLKARLIGYANTILGARGLALVNNDNLSTYGENK